MKIKQVLRKKSVKILSILAVFGVLGSAGFNLLNTALNSNANTVSVTYGAEIYNTNYNVNHPETQTNAYVSGSGVYKRFR